MQAITTTDLTKKFEALTAVDHVSFEVRQGEIFGLLGPNGAGKTTIINMLSTLTPPTAGDACVWGHSIRTARDEVRRSIGMVFQDPAVDDSLTGRENLDFHARMYGMKKDLRTARIREVLELVGLDGRADVLLKKYSGGMKRRLEIARGLMHYPRVLFLDEPTLGLDPQTRRHIWDYVKMLNEREQVTVILTTHYMEEADCLCSRIGIIDQGNICIIDTPTALKRSMGNDVLTITAADLDGLQAGLADLAWVKDMQRYGDQLLVGAQQAEEKIPLAVQAAQARGIAVSSIAMRTPTLEDVFLYYTGRRMRDEDAPAGVAPRGRMKRRGHH